MKKAMESTMVVPRGVNLAELSEGARPAGFDTTRGGFSKKSNKTNTILIVGGAVVLFVICVVLIIVFGQLHH